MQIGGTSPTSHTEETGDDSPFLAMAFRSSTDLPLPLLPLPFFLHILQWSPTFLAPETSVSLRI